MKNAIFGGIEGGGTKFVCSVGNDAGHIINQTRFPTTTPTETLEKAISFFRSYVDSDNLKVIGLGSFGPIDLNKESHTYGYITSTPKPGWSKTDIVGTLNRSLNVRIVFNTDVNVAALGEFRWGASQGFDPSLYLTIGTGVGGGYIKDGKPLVGLLSPEMGHIRIPHDLKVDPFPGSCPYHRDCFEGLASGPAIQIRCGSKGETISDNDPFWDIEAEYIASALANYILVLSPKRIVLGGGVMQREFLFPKIRQRVQSLLNDYVLAANLLENIDEYIVPPALENQSGSLGAITLAQMTE